MSATALEFAYSQATAAMKGVIMAFWYLTSTFGSLWVLLTNAAVRNEAVTARIATTGLSENAFLMFFFAAFAFVAAVGVRAVRAQLPDAGQLPRRLSLRRVTVDLAQLHCSACQRAHERGVDAEVSVHAQMIAIEEQGPLAVERAARLPWTKCGERVQMRTCGTSAMTSCMASMIGRRRSSRYARGWVESTLADGVRVIEPVSATKGWALEDRLGCFKDDIHATYGNGRSHSVASACRTSGRVFANLIGQ